MRFWSLSLPGEVAQDQRPSACSLLLSRPVQGHGRAGQDTFPVPVALPSSPGRTELSLQEWSLHWLWDLLVTASQPPPVLCSPALGALWPPCCPGRLLNLSSSSEPVGHPEVPTWASGKSPALKQPSQAALTGLILPSSRAGRLSAPLLFSFPALRGPQQEDPEPLSPGWSG